MSIKKCLVFSLFLIINTACQEQNSSNIPTPINSSTAVDTIRPDTSTATIAHLDTQHYSTKEVPIDTPAIIIKPPIQKATGDYAILKQKIKLKQVRLQQQYKTASPTKKDSLIKVAQTYISKQLIDYIFPHWYGTPWTFEGHTSIPNKGEIACSYFVSTTLLHVGFKLNRYKLAQQGPVTEARSLALQEEPIFFEILDSFEEEKFIAFEQKIIKNYPEGLYFIGLGHSHVGYLLHREGEVLFIQSSYGMDMSVVMDYAKESDVLSTFRDFVLVPITNNKELTKRWLTNQEIKILKGTD